MTQLEIGLLMFSLGVLSKIGFEALRGRRTEERFVTHVAPIVSSSQELIISRITKVEEEVLRLRDRLHEISTMLSAMKSRCDIICEMIPRPPP